MQIVSVVLVLFSLAGSASSFAALGEQATSIDQDSGRLSAKRKNADVFQKYSVQAIQSDANTIKEFVDNQGVIFAIAWKGTDHPDLAVVLGAYFRGYQETEKATPIVRGRRQRVIKRENLVVQKWSNSRTLSGRAYDPSLMPTGVSFNEIQ